MTAFLDDWDFDLPTDRIAARPAPERTASRLLHLPRRHETIVHGLFSDLPRYLREGDLLVANDSRVMAARIRARRASGGRVEFLLLEPGPGPVACLARPARRLKEGETLALEGGGEARVLSRPDEQGIMRIETTPDPDVVMARSGELPLPPYMGRTADAQDVERYQTVYAGPLGSSAAPTAGLHFTDALIEAVRALGVGFETVTLHVGLGTFRPLRPEDVTRGALHEERICVGAETAAAVREAKARGGRVIAVGTTAARTLEARACEHDVLKEGWSTTDLFIRPPYDFRVVDGLITNFHLPRSSLLMLVASLVGRTRLFAAYEEAIARGYRFYSYGDAMLLL